MTAPPSGPSRLKELDSLRGVAALVVVFYHAVDYWNPPHPGWWRAAVASPLGILVSGADAVLLFFVLSGFVLFLPYLSSGARTSYPRYVIKRICRIYLPYLAALALVLLADWYCYRPLGDALTNHPIPWTRPFPVWAILPHIVFVGPAPIFSFNGAFWSLVHEMRISLIFPLIAILALRIPLVSGVGLGLIVCVTGLFPLLSPRYAEWATIGYAGLFLMGACMAQDLERIRRFASRIGPYGRGLGFVLSILLLKSTHGLPDKLKIYPVQATLHGAAMALIVTLALTTIHFRRILHSGVLEWLGRVSYSLYLVHDTVLYAMVSLYWHKTGHHTLLIMVAIVIALGLAHLFHHAVEQPAMLLGRKLGGGGRFPSSLPGSASAATGGTE